MDDDQPTYDGPDAVPAAPDVPAPEPENAPVDGSRRRLIAGMAAAVALAVGAGLVANAATDSTGSISASATQAQPPGAAASGSDPGSAGQGSSGSGSSDPGSSGSGSSGSGSSGSGGSDPGSSRQQTDAGSGTATAAQSVGVVDINTVLGYQHAAAAGTGMILTSDGEILTNNHVVDGATKITVTVVSTGRSYTGKVVGTDPTDDVAVLQLADASGLNTVNTTDSSVHSGDAVTAVGNAGGNGGTPSAATGSVVATDRQITASDESGANAETLKGMIQIDAAVLAGDSGGPLYNSSGKVVGMDTAASSSRFGGAGEAFAIPIDNALTIVAQIRSGHETSTIHLGYPAFLGVGMSDGAAGATVSNALSGGPADGAGIVAGDVITAIGGHAVGAATDVSSALTGHRPGDRVSVTWTDDAGQSHTATVTLATGPAD